MGSYSAAIVVMIGSLILSKVFFNGFKEAIAIIFGLIVGLLIGVITEVYTSGDYGFVKKIAQQSETGSQQTVISGIAVGMQSTAVPIILIAIGIIGGIFFQWSLWNRISSRRYAFNNWYYSSGRCIRSDRR